MPYGIFTHQDAKRIYDASIGATDAKRATDRSLYKEDYEEEVLFVRLNETIVPPGVGTAPETGWTSGTGRVVVYDSSGADDVETMYDRFEVEDADAEVTVINRNPDWFGAKGDYLWVRKNDGEYAPIGTVRNELDAVLTEALAAATDPLLFPATADCKILYPSGGILVVTSWVEEVTNRNMAISLPDKTYINIKRLNGEWRLSNADCVASTIDTTGGDDDLLGVQP